MSPRSCFPVLSFLHVPGKTSRPLWLMMGTAFKIRKATYDGKPDLAERTRRIFFFLTAKHTFMPWEYTKDPSSLKIPELYRKSRYVIGRLYASMDDPERHADRCRFAEISLVSVHPTLDVALLAIKTFQSQAMERIISDAPSLSLCVDNKILSKGARSVIHGFRAEGRLGELDTFDASLLQQLSPQEREALLKELESVEGKQVLARTDVEILDPLGMCHGLGDYSQCFHGMSGSPLLTSLGDQGMCYEVVYGKHPDYPQNIGFTPSSEFLEWAQAAMQ